MIVAGAGSIVFGVDFTSAPSRKKAIVVAQGTVIGERVAISKVVQLVDFAAFDTLLATPGPWVAAFDLPFGLPRDLVTTLNWPNQWTELMRHIACIGKHEFKDALNTVRQPRPVGSRYIPRKGDAAAGSSSPMKLVNPPVGLMFFEGAPRIARSGVSVIPCAPSDDKRVALEGYPGFLARKIVKASYKKDGPEGLSPARRTNREIIVKALLDGHPAASGLAIDLSLDVKTLCINDGNGDVLDAVLCATQAAMALRAYQLGDQAFGIPPQADPLEGWIATVPGS